MADKLEYLAPWLTALDDGPAALRRLNAASQSLQRSANPTGALRCLFLAGRRARTPKTQRTLLDKIIMALNDLPLWYDSPDVRRILARWET